MYKDLGSIIIGGSSTSEIVICNNNDCGLSYELNVKQLIDESSNSGSSSKGNDQHSDYCILELDSLKGRIEGRAKHVVRCRIRPTRLVNYQFTVEYKIIYTNEEEDEKRPIDLDNHNPPSPPNQFETLCYLSATGVYPKLTITDVKGLGSASNLSKDYLWKILSINE